MDRLGAGTAGDVENLVDAEIGFRRRRWTDGIGLVGLADVKRGAIHLGVDGDRGDAHFAARTDHAHSDFSAIGDQDLLEH